MLQRQMRNVASSEATRIVMAYPVVGGDDTEEEREEDRDAARAQVLPPPAGEAALGRSSSYDDDGEDRVSPSLGGGDWVPPELRRALALATPDELRARARELAESRQRQQSKSEEAEAAAAELARELAEGEPTPGVGPTQHGKHQGKKEKGRRGSRKEAGWLSQCCSAAPRQV
jgi:hypothetical protein